MKKNLSVLLAIILLCSCCFISTSAKEQQQSIEISIDELALGEEVVAYFYTNGEILVQKESPNNRKTYSAASSSQVAATFHVGLTRMESQKAYLYWTANVCPPAATGLKNVTGGIYCQNTSVLSPVTYYSTSIKCPYLNGTTYLAQGSTGTFGLPITTTTFRVGYTNLNLRTINKDYYFGNGSSIVNR